MDESGVHDGSPVLTVGAYYGMPHEWRRWVKAWNKRKKPIKVFHAADCANLKGEFRGWRKDARDEYVAELLPIIGNANLFAFSVGIVMEDYREVQGEFPEITAYLGNPYTACFQWVVQNILETMARVGERKKWLFFTRSMSIPGTPLNASSFYRRTMTQIVSLHL